MTKDVRKEQVQLLKFEKKLAGLAAFVAAGSATAASAADKINAEATMKAYDDISKALVQLADVTTQAHAALQSSALEAGVRIFEANGGGTGKNPPAEIVRSLLGIG
ncbi:MAG: hypothetical protein ACKVS5_08980 [Parvularculaceae bacterium]